MKPAQCYDAREQQQEERRQARRFKKDRGLLTVMSDPNADGIDLQNTSTSDPNADELTLNLRHVRSILGTNCCVGSDVRSYVRTSFAWTHSFRYQSLNNVVLVTH